MPLCAVVLDRSEVAAKEQRRTTVGERSRGAPSFFSLSAWVRDGRGGRVVRRAIDTVLACQGLDPPPPSVTWRRPQPAASSSSSIRGRGVADLPLLGRHWPDKLFFKLVPTFGAGEEEWWIASLLWEAVDFPTPSCCLFRLSPDVLPSQQEPWELGVEKHGAHEVHIIYWHCISLLYFRSLPQGCYRNYEPHLIGLIMNENTGDFLSLERAEILCSMSFVLLKGFLSEQSRDGCCNFCSVQMADVVSWLLKAFVLSGESPSLLEEDYTLAHVFTSNSPVMYINILGGDFVDVLGEALLLPSLFPAWMLLSMFDSTNKPTTMLLPVYSISKEAHNEDSSIKELDNPTRASDKKWKCPWSCTIVDYVAPTFRKLLEDNFRSLSGAIGIPKDGQENTVRWWSDRMKLNDDLNVKV